MATNDKRSLLRRLLLSEWFYIGMSAHKQAIEGIDSEISKSKNSVGKAPEAPLDIHDFQTETIKKRVILLIVSLVGIGIVTPMFVLMIKHWDWVNQVAQTSSGAIYLAVIALGILAVAVVISLIYSIYSIFDEIGLRKFSDNDYRSEYRQYEQSLQSYNQRAAASQDKIKRLSAQRVRLDRDYSTLCRAFDKSMDFIYPKYRNIVCVSQFIQYLESGRAETFEGPYGCYNIFEQELRANLIIAQLDVIISDLDEIIQNQREMVNTLHSIESVAKDIRQSMDDIKQIGLLQLLATQELSAGIADVESSVRNVGSSFDSFDQYYRRYH